MTTKQGSDQEQDFERAVWLTPASPQTTEEHRTATDERRARAAAVARSNGARIVGEFEHASPAGELSDHAWSEVLSFLPRLGATTLVVLAPDDLSHDQLTCYERTQVLAEADIRLVIAPPIVQHQQDGRTTTEDAA